MKKHFKIIYYLSIMICTMCSLENLAQDNKPLALTGTQADAQVIISPAKEAHTITGEYVIPEGKELKIEAGTVISFNKDASLSVSGGDLIVAGKEDAPVIFTGKAKKAGYWKGITILNTKNTVIDYCWICSADTGISIKFSKPQITNTLIENCVNGINSDNHAGANVENTIIRKNKKNGISLNSSKIILKNCCICDNENGISGGYYPGADITDSIITKNKESGIFGSGWPTTITAHNSSIIGNGKHEVCNKTGADWDFSKCWWGTYTKSLQTKGDTFNIPKISDGLDKENKGSGRVRINDFLTEEPNDIGAKLQVEKWKQ